MESSSRGSSFSNVIEYIGGSRAHSVAPESSLTAMKKEALENTANSKTTKKQIYCMIVKTSLLVIYRWHWVDVARVELVEGLTSSNPNCYECSGWIAEQYCALVSEREAYAGLKCTSFASQSQTRKSDCPSTRESITKNYGQVYNNTPTIMFHCVVW